jgi:hypothetical protein
LTTRSRLTSAAARLDLTSRRDAGRAASHFVGKTVKDGRQRRRLPRLAPKLRIWRSCENGEAAMAATKSQKRAERGRNPRRNLLQMVAGEG